MRKQLLFIALAFAAFPVAAQQQSQSSDNGKAPAASQASKKGENGKKGESDYERRIRTEGAAGGTAPVPQEERQGVGAGAKPHMHFDPMDRGLHRRSEADVVAPSK
jgi:hypothetical protein